jgi:hypothetical protein
MHFQVVYALQPSLLVCELAAVGGNCHQDTQPRNAYSIHAVALQVILTVTVRLRPLLDC